MEAYQEQPIEQLIEQLEKAGRHPDISLLAAILERREEATPLLLQLFDESLGDEWETNDDPRWLRGIHAGQILRYWKEPKALPIFIRFYENNDNACDWFAEHLWEYGEIAIEPFGEFFLRAAKKEDKEDDETYQYGRALAAGTLANIGRKFPEMRARVTEILSSVLPPLETIPELGYEDYNEVWTNLVGDLGRLQHEESRAQIEALFEADLIETFMVDIGYYKELMAGQGYDSPLEPYDLLGSYEKSQHIAKKAAKRQAAREKEERMKEERKARGAKRAAQREQNTVQVQQGNKMVKKVVKLGRNEPCHCGSGKKYKKCCFKK